MTKFKLIALLLFFSVASKAQDSSFLKMTEISNDTIPVDNLSVGIGGGYEFGGIGANIIYYPIKNIGVFFGAGYPLTGFGYNAGVKIRIVADGAASVFMPYIVGMYGYNATIRIPDYPELNKIFYGVTVGGGIDYRPGNSKFGYISATVYIPFRTGDQKYYISNDLNNQRGIPYSTGRIYPLSASIGYKFILRRDKYVPEKIVLQ